MTKRPYSEVLFRAMSNDVVLDAIVDLARHNAAVEEVVFGAIGSETNDACGLYACHPRYLR